ncbi:MAG: polysaccharide biosynthesis/export family protein [Prevotella sp.]
MKINHLIAVLLIIAAFYSCGSTKEITYFQDIPYETTIRMTESQQIKLKPGDKISIVVNSRDQQLTALFNLPTITRYIGSGINTMQGQYASLYTITTKGDIDFPILGTVHVAGLSRSELAAKIKNQLISADLVKDPTVSVEYQNLVVSVLGEVRSPGRYPIDRDQYTILDAIAHAGDLTINGVRKNVTVLREENNIQKAYKIDLTSDSSLVNSPAYYLRQGDYVYIQPNNKKARESTVNGNNILSTSFWISLASLATSVAVLIFK